MSWRSSSCNSGGRLLRFLVLDGETGRRPGYGMRRCGIYCFGLVFETDFGISFA
jgi:hypothetical protein